MKQPVIDAIDLLAKLTYNKIGLNDKIKTLLTQEQIKTKTEQTLRSTSKEQSALIFKEVLDSIQETAFIKGQLALVDNLINTIQATIDNMKEE